MDNKKNDDLRGAVRDNYGRIALSGVAGCGCASPSCCGSPIQDAAGMSLALGYSPEDVTTVPEGSNMGLGCGNPRAIADLKPGETVLDLGSGGGFDCFLAARAVGDKGYVIGVDMTPEMIEKSRRNAEKTGFTNVDFRLGELENLPVGDGIVDVIISNCVINLSPDKSRVFQEAFRVLKPGGRLMVSDIVLLKELPAALKESIDAYVGCVAGADLKEDYLDAIGKAGFREVSIIDETIFPLRDFLGYANAVEVQGCSDALMEMARELETAIASIKVQAVKGNP